ncbi:MAG: polysaccharide deacetylase family protein [Sediminibacterium sp.]|nr:polysaccharide deacetylase family protein [Sediminibacterium sp.]
MKPPLLQPKKIVKLLYPKALFRISGKNKNEVFLTFDDGPIPDLTEWILDELKRYNAKATFFCVGANIVKHPHIFSRILNEGHKVANHTYNHIKGFKTNTADYMEQVRACEKLTGTKLFRPPYGQLKRSQYKALLNEQFTIALWDVISYDYEKISPERCAQNVLKNYRSGSIILFHDNVKANDNVKYALPLVLQDIHLKGLTTGTL